MCITPACQQAWTPAASRSAATCLSGCDAAMMTRSAAVARYSPEFMDRWVATHEAEAQQLHKPLLLEEFGKKLAPATSHAAVEAGLTAGRDGIYDALFSTVEQSIERRALVHYSAYLTMF